VALGVCVAVGVGHASGTRARGGLAIGACYTNGEIIRHPFFLMLSATPDRNGARKSPYAGLRAGTDGRRPPFAFAQSPRRRSVVLRSCR